MDTPYAFGRLEAPDERDTLFQMRAVLDPLREQFFPRGLPLGTRHYFSGEILNQGQTGTCVAHGWTAKMHAAPIMQKLPGTPYDLYRRIILVDEWLSNDREYDLPDDQLQSGTSVRAGAKVLQAMGYASNYLWASSAEDVRAWMLAGFGGVVIGVRWTAGMLETDTDGFIRYTGQNYGGHAVYLNGNNDRIKYNGRVVQAFRGQNSWGRSWGQNGRFWLLYDDLDKLLSDRGEACALTEQRVR